MDLQYFLRALSVGAIPIVLAVTLHEVAHGCVARLLGDGTAAALGRLSLNPLKHIDPIGTVIIPGFLFLVGSPFLFGWAKPVPINPRNFANPKRDMAIVALAGPASNLLMAIIWTVLLGLAVAGVFGDGPLAGWIAGMGKIGLLFNVLLAVFNLVPIPPLDGGRVMVGVLPAAASRSLERVEPFGMWIVIGLLLLSSRSGYSLAPIVDRLTRLLIQVFT